MKKKYIMALSAGHASTDMNVGALATMLPFLMVATGMGYAQAAGLTFAIAVTSSLTQPFFGIIADKYSKTWLVPAGVLLSGAGLAVIGLLSNHYWLMFTAALLSGLGVAAFHPEGARMANKLSGEKKGGTMSVFTVGGTLGIATGPLIAAPVLFYFGLQGSLFLMVPGLIMCVWIIRLIPGMRGLAATNELEEQKARVEKGGDGQKNEWLLFFWLCMAITFRSIISHSMNTFLPSYWVNNLHQSMATGGIVVSFKVFIGAIVTVICGPLADRFGMLNIIKVGWLLMLPSIFFLTDITNPILALVMLIPIAAGNYGIMVPLIVLGQKCLPKSIGFASGIVLGLGGSIGGMVTPLLGMYADAHGLAAALRLLAILPAIGLGIAFLSKPSAK